LFIVWSQVFKEEVSHAPSFFPANLAGPLYMFKRPGNPHSPFSPDFSGDWWGVRSAYQKIHSEPFFQRFWLI
jgi:hypothetical protein